MTNSPEIKFTRQTPSMWQVTRDGHLLGIMRKTTQGYIVINGDAHAITPWLPTQRLIKEFLNEP